VAESAGESRKRSVCHQVLNNHITTSGYAYDASGNGNLTTIPGVGAATYDVENRLATAAGYSYVYSENNQRVLKYSPGGSVEIHFFGLDGRELGNYQPGIGQSGTVWTFSTLSKNLYFNGKTIQANNQAVVTDRLGSVRANGANKTFNYYPYGEEYTIPPAENQVKYGTYYRDQETGLDYADQRFYRSISATFLTADPYRASANGVNNPANPGSWNRYAYVVNDPVNFYDPYGLNQCNGDQNCYYWQAPPSHPPPPQSGQFGDLLPLAPPVQAPTFFNPGAPAFGGQAGGVSAGNVAVNAMEQPAIMKFTPDCQSFLLGSVGDVLTKVQDAANTANVVDASTVNTPTGTAAFPHDPTLAAAEQARDDAQTGISGTTIAQLFASKGTLYAMGQYNGNTVFYGQAFLTFGTGYALYTMFHESLHLIGLSDRQLKTDFAISDAVWAAQGSLSITLALMAGCGH
jgi:RHS repeat-associated protein